MGQPQLYSQANMNPLLVLTFAASAMAAPVVPLLSGVGHAIVPGTGVFGHAIAPTLYTGAVAGVAAVNPKVNLNIPAPIPNGAVGPQNVQTFKVTALGRPVVEYTPQITKVVPELNIVERTYDVAVPKPVYQTKEVTPLVTKHIPEPYDVPAPYAVPNPVAVPRPVPAPYAVPTIQHVGVAHHVGLTHQTTW